MLSDETIRYLTFIAIKMKLLGNCTTIIINFTLMLSATKHDYQTKLLSLEYTVSLQTESMLCR